MSLLIVSIAMESAEHNNDTVIGDAAYWRDDYFPGISLIKEVKISVGGHTETYSRPYLEQRGRNRVGWVSIPGFDMWHDLQMLQLCHPDMTQQELLHVLTEDPLRHRRQIGRKSFAARVDVASVINHHDEQMNKDKVMNWYTHCRDGGLADLSKLYPTALKKMTSRADNSNNAMNCVLGVLTNIIHACARCYRNMYDGDCLTICVSCAHDLSHGRTEGAIDLWTFSRGDARHRCAIVQMQPIGKRKKCTTCNGGIARVYRRKCKCGNGVNDAIVRAEVHSRCRKCRYVHWRSIGCTHRVADTFASVGMLMLLPIDILNMLRKYVS